MRTPESLAGAAFAPEAFACGRANAYAGSHGVAEDAGLSVSVRVPCRFCRREWTAWLAAMRRTAFPHGAALPAVELVVCGDGEIATANVRLLGCSGPTNILSFPEGGRSLGSLMLSAVTLERESVLYGQDVSAHARRLLAHGMGHLCGLDHGPEMEAFCARLEAACTSMVQG